MMEAPVSPVSSRRSPSRSPSPQVNHPFNGEDEEQQADIMQEQEQQQQQTGANISNRGNPFSIDYILSSSSQQPLRPPSAIAPQTQTQSKLLDQQHYHHLNLINQQRVQLMAAAVSQHQSTADFNQRQATATNMQKQQQQQANPSFLYFMACMLLQQQQKQQQEQQQLQQQQLQRQQQQAAAMATAANQSRQPINLARSSAMDSLAILARLTASAASASIPMNGSSLTAPMTTKQRPSNNNIRHQPYPQAASSQYSSHLPPHHHHHHHLHPQPQPQPPLPPPPPPPPSKPPQQHQQLQNIPQQPITGKPDKLDNLKPAHSYIGLIGMCILSSPEKRMVLNDIYQFIMDNYPYYRSRGSGWRNSVRHNLSLNECFQKAGRAANGKGHYWTIHPANMEDFMAGDFRRRRAQRKVRRWNNMDVPSDESEDESMEDATKPPLPEHFKRSLEMHRQLELSYQKHNMMGSLNSAAGVMGGSGGPLDGERRPPPPIGAGGGHLGSLMQFGRKQEL